MTLFFYILIGIITFLAFVHASSKKEYDLSRTVVINRPKAEVFAFVRQLKKQHLWIPWFSQDPNAVLKFNGQEGYENATLYWKGNSRIGEGTQRIIKIREGKIMESKLFFIRPHKILALTYIAVKEIDIDKTKLVWGIKGKYTFPVSLIKFFYSMERVVENDFEAGLQNLKKILEVDKN